VRTTIVTFSAGKSSALLLDANAKGGEIRVQFRDNQGRVIPGFSFTECRPIAGNGLAQQLVWKQLLSELKVRPFRIEFSLKNAKLYGFSFAKKV
jgi:hypothetical protein